MVNASSKLSSPMLTKACISLETMGCDTGVATGGLSLATTSVAVQSCTLVVSYDRLANGTNRACPAGAARVGRCSVYDAGGGQSRVIIEADVRYI